MVSVHPARWCTSPLGVVPAGLGDGVGDCHDAANLPRVCLFISLIFHFWGKNLTTFFQGKVSCICLPLGMLVAKKEPTPCYHDAYSVGTPNGAFWGKTGKNTVRPWFHPCLDVSFWYVNGPFTFLGSCGLDAPYREGQTSWSWSTVFYPWSTVY